jgi:hypothetical protein
LSAVHHRLGWRVWRFAARIEPVCARKFPSGAKKPGKFTAQAFEFVDRSALSKATRIPVGTETGILGAKTGILFCEDGNLRA